jgi:hypothetical protein
MATSLPELHGGLLALLGGIVTTAVFTIGFASHRSHTTLMHARALLHRPAGKRGVEHARDTASHARLVLVVNSALFVLGVIAAAFAWGTSHEWEDALTLIGFIALLLTILVLGYRDHLHVRRAVNHELTEFGMNLCRRTRSGGSA